ncbi:MAG: methionine--tRNA ligase [Brevinematales bacterium]|nr:methionine--tRNA ligase [Brevinematales bacterium]
MAKYLVTSALPYANGPIHLGHLAGAYLPADIFVRFLRLNGDDVVYICGSDEHGVPITLRAEQEKVSPREIVEKYHKIMYESFKKMRIEFDNFSGTARKDHYELSQKFFMNLYEGGYISKKTEKQYFDEKAGRFLPDRYIEGKCPFCGYEKARGDQCDKCGKLLNPLDLIEPRSVLTGEKPVIKETTHWYLKLQDFEEKLVSWITSNTHWKENVRNFVLGWIKKEGLKERAITRDIDWGVPVPLPEAKGKVLYVWFDAPIGYISSTIEWSKNIGKPDKWKEYWFDKETKIIHFIGKDNIPFHAVIWPAMLMGQKEKYVLPFDIPANEYLTLEGEKFSTSQNWALWVDEYLAEFPADPLRYFLASNAPETKDADFSWKAFQIKNNEELANIYGNFANRVFTFVNKRFNGVVPEAKYEELELNLFKEIEDKIKEIKYAYQNFSVREASKLMMDIARAGNKYFDETKPWSLKDDKRLKTVMNTCLNLLRILAVASYPIIPESAEKLWRMLGEENDIRLERWDSLGKMRIKDGQKLGNVEILFVKYEDEIIEKQLKKLYDKSKAKKEDNKMEYITIEDFKKIDIRVAEVIDVIPLEKSNKLLKIKVKVGEIEKQIVAGIKQFYKPEELVGKKIIILNNLEPAKLMGETSEGMLLAASNDDKSILSVLTVERDVPSGSKVS